MIFKKYYAGIIHSNDEFSSVVKMLLADRGYVLCLELCVTMKISRMSFIFGAEFTSSMSMLIAQYESK